MEHMPNAHRYSSATQPEYTDDTTCRRYPSREVESGIGNEHSNDNRQGDETVATGYCPAVCKIAPIWRTATNPEMTGIFLLSEMRENSLGERPIERSA
jgi:hypothetical protein